MPAAAHERPCLAATCLAGSKVEATLPALDTDDIATLYVPIDG